uniref:Uncharacterized protein n=1 Tax=Dunaliella tertiolecta TaxID=3047 RepID=A0A7S3VMM7_DUNTE|mmetsp:Transcript_8036/g.21406  ORF Transcript_8036/g.21406 Transcript_8036/m.21406 type:complete len:490 (-) Transcript_8036:1641-3110(-)|eukprot:CAMPEP_0202343356 /NCGR_PEP_ID=MMETSP1126-20121109/3511_1 /ASSEMBLY_ACC=CAM_ASM_000457 /TAXON_ID=3047 /ORGANISM="Dunaliella tertiolecta, Strain CCMP1320" /LENGTH=489 /DNA_ID=CAMNT_0048934411 /DNA_START=262 /DNA_END=1731 /DNA_ORIENTATION=+
MSYDWDMPFDQLVQIFQDNHESNKARKSSAGKSAGLSHRKGGDPDESEGKCSSNQGSSIRGSSCFGLSSRGSSSKARLSSSSGGSKSTILQPCNGTPMSLARKVEDAEDERGTHDLTASSAPLSFPWSGLVKKDAYTSTPSVCLVAMSEGSDRLTPLQQFRKAILATSSAFFRISSWSSKPCSREGSFDSSPSAKAPPQQDKACTVSTPLHSQPPLSPSLGGRALTRQIKPGLSHSLNSRTPSIGTNEMNAQSLQLKSCLSRSLDRNVSKRVSFPLEILGVGGSPGELDACAHASDCRPSSTCRSQDATPPFSGNPSCSTTPPPLSPECSARSSSARSRSSAGTYFFQGTLGRSRRSSNSDGTPPTLEYSQSGDKDAAQEDDSQVDDKEVSRELEFYQFAKPFDLGLEGEKLQTYACSPNGVEGNATIVDHAGCVVRRVKSGSRARRNGYMLEAEQIERNYAKGGMAATESWPVKLANAIVAIPPPFED